MALAIDLLAPLALLAIGYAYARRCQTLAGNRRAVPVWRQSCFAAGLLVLFVADSPWLGSIAEEIIVAHMAQHLLIGDVAALLVVLGLTGPLLQPILALRGLRWTRWLGNPLIALPLWAFNLYLWHLGALYQGVLDSPGLHLAQHLAFLGFGVVMWMPLLGPLPTPQWFNFGARLVYLVGVRFCGAVLGNVLAWSGSALYPDFESGETEWGLSPLADQGAAGSLMMVEGGFVTLGVFAWLFLRWAMQDEESQRLVELAAARGVELDRRRAGRAVAAGRTDELERRLGV
ncbi:MAG: cytochrome c oxidase assembly protein [Solirubrobacterales bacterium]